MSMLKTPITINQLQLPNRLVMPPMATAKSEKSGAVSEALCRYYSEKSLGSYIGLIITEHSYISAAGKASEGQLSIARDSDIDGLKRLVQTMHDNQTCTFAQINHAGIAASPKITGCEAMGPSSVAPVNRPAPEVLPRTMTLQDIANVKREFVEAARRAKAAGYDGVEIHSAHGYLLNQFYSPLTNKRTDAYGGSLSNRIRLHLEVIGAVREEVGSDYPVAIRLGGCDYMDGGSTIEDAVAACQAFEQAGVDLLDITGGLCGYRQGRLTGQGYFRDISSAIRSHVHIPVLLTGGIIDGAGAEALLAEGDADMIGVGRAIMQNSDWARAAMESLD